MSSNIDYLARRYLRDLVRGVIPSDRECIRILCRIHPRDRAWAIWSRIVYLAGTNLNFGSLWNL